MQEGNNERKDKRKINKVSNSGEKWKREKSRVRMEGILRGSSQ